MTRRNFIRRTALGLAAAPAALLAKRVSANCTGKESAPVCGDLSGVDVYVDNMYYQFYPAYPLRFGDKIEIVFDSGELHLLVNGNPVDTNINKRKLQ
jgi:hypothetical protein